jgi:hypothetical protein
MAFIKRSWELMLAKFLGNEAPPCENAPASYIQRGKCHVCQVVKEDVGYCGLCCHWFCIDCEDDVVARVQEALMEQIQGSTPGCCGPEA